MKKHLCSKSAAKEHRVARLATRDEVLAHTGKEPFRLMAHGLCGECFEKVVMCKIGKYHHVAVY